VQLAPFLEAGLAVQLHVGTALAAIVLGTVQYVGRKGTRAHRRLGTVWIGLVAAVALSSFAIPAHDGWLGFSWIHGLSVLTLVGLVRVVTAARAGNIARHRALVAWLFAGGVVLGGGLALGPDRLLHTVVFGG